jgi:hypothetical protein
MSRIRNVLALILMALAALAAPRGHAAPGLSAPHAGVGAQR